jgi:hypothetical protein
MLMYDVTAAPLHPRTQVGALVPLVPHFDVFDEGPAAVFIQGEKPVAPSPEIDEGRLDRLGDVYHLRLVDVPLVQFSALVLHLEVVENTIAYDGNADLFGVGPVDEHHLLRALSRGDFLPLLVFLGLFLLAPR